MVVTLESWEENPADFQTGPFSFLPQQDFFGFVKYKGFEGVENTVNFICFVHSEVHK